MGRKKKGELTIPGAIVEAARALTNTGQCTFTKEELCVLAWKRHPKLMGLRGYESQYPDINRVGACLSHKDGPIKQGHLIKADDRGRLRLSAELREAV